MKIFKAFFSRSVLMFLTLISTLPCGFSQTTESSDASVNTAPVDAAVPASGDTWQVSGSGNQQTFTPPRNLTDELFSNNITPQRRDEILRGTVAQLAQLEPFIRGVVVPAVLRDLTTSVNQELLPNNLRAILQSLTEFNSHLRDNYLFIYENAYEYSRLLLQFSGRELVSLRQAGATPSQMRSAQRFRSEIMRVRGLADQGMTFVRNSFETVNTLIVGLIATETSYLNELTAMRRSASSSDPDVASLDAQVSEQSDRVLVLNQIRAELGVGLMLIDQANVRIQARRGPIMIPVIRPVAPAPGASGPAHP